MCGQVLFQVLGSKSLDSPSPAKQLLGLRQTLECRCYGVLEWSIVGINGVPPDSESPATCGQIHVRTAPGIRGDATAAKYK